MLCVYLVDDLVCLTYMNYAGYSIKLLKHAGIDYLKLIFK